MRTRSKVSFPSPIDIPLEITAGALTSSPIGVEQSGKVSCPYLEIKFLSI